MPFGIATSGLEFDAQNTTLIVVIMAIAVFVLAAVTIRGGSFSASEQFQPTEARAIVEPLKLSHAKAAPNLPEPGEGPRRLGMAPPNPKRQRRASVRRDGTTVAVQIALADDTGNLFDGEVLDRSRG